MPLKQLVHTKQKESKLLRRKVIIYPYIIGSESAAKLSAQLETKRVKSHGRYRWFRNHTIINWGNPRFPVWATPQAMRNMLNLPQYVAIASDKLRSLRILSEAGILVPDFTTDIDQAKAWAGGDPKFPRKLHAILCRTLTRANSGRGIVVATNSDEIVPAPLYTRYTPKSHEYRVHVALGQIIDAQEKRRPNGWEAKETDGQFNRYIRNHENGWVFCREDVMIPQVVGDAALLAVEALHLDFGAVDIGYHEEYGAFVYEVNTAPGLEGQTLTNYVNIFSQYVS